MSDPLKMSDPLLIYGANGFTGALTARHAVEQGLRPILAGRNRDAIAAIAGELGLESRIFSLDDPAAVQAALHGMTAVLHCAGPFAETSHPMVEACLATRTHYLDITGEIAVFEGLAGRDDEARAAGVMLLPGVGFDVVPSDCLAAHLARRLPDAQRLLLAMRGSGHVSRGTATTALRALAAGATGMVRQAGELTPAPPGWKRRQVDFGEGAQLTATIPWGDVSTAYHSTGIPNIEVYAAVSRLQARVLALSRHFGALLRARGVQSLGAAWIQRQAPGPTEAERARGECCFWGRVENVAGDWAESRLRTPEAYQLTALTALLIARRVLNGDRRAGFQTPSSAYGADLVLEIDGVERVDLV